MKTVILQVTNLVLRLTPVNEENDGRFFGSTEEIELPEKLKNGGALTNLPYFAGFVSNSMLNTGYRKSRVVFCLEGGQIVTKEYPHIHINKFEDLLQTARLEAESVLHGDAENYVVTTPASGYKDNASGQEKSVLYAVPKALVKNIIREFGKKNITVAKIVPPITGFIHSCKTLLNICPENPECQSKTAGVIEFAKGKNRLGIFCGGVPVFQKDFDSPRDEILDLLEKSENMHREDALKLTGRGGFLLNCGAGSISENTVRRIKALTDASTGEIIRSVRSVLGAKRLDIDGFVICGSLAARPDFNEFIGKRLLGVPFENISSNPRALNIQLDAQAVTSGAKAADFFTLNGILTITGHDDIDFMYEQNNARKIFLRYVYASIILVIALATALTVQMLIYKGAEKNIAADSNLLNTNQITNIKNLLKNSDSLDGKNMQAENYKKNLPYQKSHSEEIFAKLQEQVYPYVLSVNTCKIDNGTGEVTLDFTVSDVDSFNSVRSNIENDGYFKVIVPFTITKNTQNAASGFKCSTVLDATDFTPLKINGVASKSGTEGDSH